MEVSSDLAEVEKKLGSLLVISISRKQGESIEKSFWKLSDTMTV